MTLPASAQPAPFGDVGAKAQSILRRPAYRFCHDPRYPWTDAEAQWCAVVGERNERCEALPKACQGEMTHATYGGRGKRGWGETREDRETFTLHLPNVGPIFSVVLWVALAIGVALLLRAILSRALGRRDTADLREAGQAAPLAETTATKNAVEIDVQRLLDRARRAASDGRFGDGVADAYAALLRQLEGERLLRIDPWRTNGDYLRDLGRRPDVRAEVRPVVHDVEGIQFGGQAPTSERFESVYRQVSALLSASASRMAHLGSVAFVLCLALTFVSCADLFGRGMEDDAPSGTSAVVELMRQAGLEPTMRFRSLSKVISADQIVLLPGARLDPASWHNLIDWVDDGGTLIVANRDTWSSKWPRVQFSARPDLTTKLTVGSAAPEAIRGASVVVPGTNELLIPKETDSWKELLGRDGSVYAATFEYGEGKLIALADGRLFTNASVAMADNAAFLVGLFGSDKKRIDVVGELTGSGSKSPLSSVERGKLAPVLLQLGLVLALFFLYKGVAFGSLRDPPSATRRSFADHARALGLLYAKAHASGHARSIYGVYALERLRESALLRDKKGIGALAEVVAARSGRPMGQVAMMLVEAQEPLPTDPKEKGAPDDLDLIRRLSRLLFQSKGVSK